MTHEDMVTRQIIEVVQGSVHAASEDYFIWSRGHILYDCAEFLPQVYAAKRLFDIFKYEVTVRLERPLAELAEPVLPKTRHRVDLTVEFDAGTLYAIEFKRYTTEKYMASDLARLGRITIDKRDRIGLLVAPCYMMGESDDWPLRDKEIHANDPSQIRHLSDAKPLAESYKHVKGFTHERVLVIEVRDAARL